MEFKKDIKLELKDLLDSAYSILLPRLLILVGVIAAMSFAIIYLLEGPSFFEEGGLLITVIALIVVIILFSVSIIFSSRRSLKKQFKSNAMLKEASQISIDNLSFSQVSNSTDSKVTWNMIYRVKELKNSYNFYISNIMYVLIPKRFLTQEEESTLRSLINDNLDPKKNKLKKH